MNSQYGLSLLVKKACCRLYPNSADDSSKTVLDQSKTSILTINIEDITIKRYSQEFSCNIKASLRATGRGFESPHQLHFS